MITMQITKLTAFLSFALVCACPAQLLVYEPFDYQIHNHEIQGRLEGRNGGLGFSEPWKDTAGSAGHAFIYDQRGNTAKLFSGGRGESKPAWDGVVDNLPTMGGYMGTSDWDLSGSFHSTRRFCTRTTQDRQPFFLLRGQYQFRSLSLEWHDIPLHLVV